MKSAAPAFLHLVTVLCLAGAFTGSSVTAADFTSTWNAGDGDWGNGSNWITPGAAGTIPKNGTSTYDAILSNGGRITLDQDITIQNFTFSNGGVLGGFDLTMNENLLWTGGIMGGAGATTVAGAGSILGGAGEIGLDRILNNTGVITNNFPDGAVGFRVGRGANTPGVLNNIGSFNITAGGDFGQFNGHPDHAINNQGVWNVSGAGTTSAVHLPFNNTGEANITSGAMTLHRGGVSTGSFNVAAGATLHFFSDTTHLLDHGAAISGAGLTTFSGTLQVGNDAADVVSAETFSITSGNLFGSGSFNVGSLAWTGGTIGGAGTMNVAGAASTISGSDLGLDRTLNNTGALTYSSGEADLGVRFGRSANTPGVLNNIGSLHVTAGGDFAVFNPHAGHAINNSGTWTVSGQGTTSTVRIPFNNSGAVNVNEGTLAFTGGFIQTEGSLNLGGGAISTDSALNLQGGLLQGAGTISGNVSNNATISPGFSAGHIDIVGDLLLGLESILLFEIGGIGQGATYDYLTESGGSALLPNGSLALMVINGFDPTGLSFTVLGSNQNFGVGEFLNVAAGERLETMDGLGSFQVDYGTGSPHLVLSNFILVPEPGAWTLLVLGLGFVIGARRRQVV